MIAEGLLKFYSLHLKKKKIICCGYPYYAPNRYFRYKMSSRKQFKLNPMSNVKCQFTHFCVHKTYLLFYINLKCLYTQYYLTSFWYMVIIKALNQIHTRILWTHNHVLFAYPYFITNDNLRASFYDLRPLIFKRTYLVVCKCSDTGSSWVGIIDSVVKII